MTMCARLRRTLLLAGVGAGLLIGAPGARADGNLNNVNHIIIVMQENHSYDNYFGVLGYVLNSPYHNAKSRRGCNAADTTCVDGLSCKTPRNTGVLTCKNKNPSNFPGSVRSFHEPRLCTGPDLDHSWDGSHQEGNFKKVNDMLHSSPNNGFVRVNAETEAPGQTFDHDTMGFYNDGDLPFYYDIAKTFGVSDRYFCAVIGQTFPNRAYLVAGTSFGHLTTSEIGPPKGGYKPITGTIYDRLDAAGVSWTDYFSDLPYSFVFGAGSSHQKSISAFAADAAAGTLPAVAFVDGSVLKTQPINGSTYETDEHPPADIRAGEYVVSQVITALRNSPSWNDSILFLTYDEHGGYYDHVKPAAADQGGADTPDGIQPGQCADLSNPPASELVGAGANCNHSRTVDAPGICADFSPTGAFPENCATFDQLGFRVPLVAVSPFSKPHYVSHVVNSHTSFLALIERRFGLTPLTARDAHANDFEDMFDFDNSPSLSSPLNVTAPLPRQPPAFSPGDNGCPFS
jgi:phospholipase C